MYIETNTFSGKTFKTKREVYHALNELYELSSTVRQWRYYFDKPENAKEKEILESLIEKKTATVSGKTVSVIEDRIDVDTLFDEMSFWFEDEKELEQTALNNTITFDTDLPIAIVFTADQHFGGGFGTATNIKKVFSEMRAVVDTPNTFMMHVGDLSNNFIGSWTTPINHSRKFSIPEEYAISKKYITEVMQQKTNYNIATLLAFITGNHNYWAELYGGYNTNLELLQKAKETVLFDNDELFVNIVTNYTSTGILLRHKWNGHSIYNPTHGIERFAKMNNIYDADVYVGAHIHSGGLIRDFVKHGQTAFAALCGTYKTIDKYSKTNGFYKANDTTAVGIIIHPEFGILRYSNIYALCDYMESYA